MAGQRASTCTTAECLRCGACCIGQDVLLTNVEAACFESDPHLLPLTTLYQFASGLTARFMRRDRGTDRCVAAAGRLGDCHCRIYAERPQLCREFVPGSPDCLAARARQGLVVALETPAPPRDDRGT